MTTAARRKILYDELNNDSTLQTLLGSSGRIHSIKPPVDRDGKLSAQKPFIVYRELKYGFDYTQGCITNKEAIFETWVVADEQIKLFEIVDRIVELFNRKATNEYTLETKEVGEDEFVSEVDGYTKSVMISVNLY